MRSSLRLATETVKGKVFHVRAGHRGDDGLLPVARPGAERPKRNRRRLLNPPPRRVRPRVTSDGEGSLLDDASHYDRRGKPRHAGQGCELLVAEGLVGDQQLVGRGLLGDRFFGDRFKVLRGDSRRFEEGVRGRKNWPCCRESALASDRPWPCSRSPTILHGKAGVNGSSPLEGFAKCPANWGFRRLSEPLS